MTQGVENKNNFSGLSGLGIGRSKAYTFLDEVYENQKPFRVVKIGRLYRVPKEVFDKWLNGEI
ncbi:hypothetical protein CDL27_10290 [Mediterraneibacter gnavus]|nr:hypothetical protein CDL27_10290 [Mediterraneibacter gnavus]